MDVKELKKLLEKVDENLEVCASTRASQNIMGIDFIEEKKNVNVLILYLNDLDFSLDKEGLYEIDKLNEKLYKWDKENA